MKTFLEYIIESMDLSQAKKIFGIDSIIPSKEEITKLYRKLSMQNHPDRGGSTEKMSEINQAKEILLKNVGKGSSSKSSYPTKEEFIKKQEVAGKLEDLEMSKFDPIIYLDYIEKIFKKTFILSKNEWKKADPVKDTHSNRIIEISDKERDIVFLLKIFPEKSFLSLYNTYYDLFENPKNIGGGNTTIGISLHSEVYVNGKKQVLQKGYTKESSDSKLFKDPSILLPKDRLTKIAEGKVRANSKLSKRDFVALFTQKFDGENSGDKFIFYFKNFVMVLDRMTLMRSAVYFPTFHKKSDNNWYKYSSEKYFKGHTPFIPETQESFESFKNGIAQLKKDEDIEKFLKNFEQN